MFNFRKVHIPQLYFRTMWILALFLYILIPLKSALVGLIYKGIVLVSFGSFILLSAVSISRGRSIWNKKHMVYFLLLLLAIALSFALHSGAMTFNVQIMGILGFLEMPLAVVLMDHVRYSEKNTRFILTVNIWMAVVFSLLSVSKYAYSGILDSLYLGYSNPNATGVYLLLNQAILIIFLPTIRNRNLRRFVTALCVYEEYLIYLTDSRTCVLVSVLIVVYYFFGKRIQLPKWIIPAALLIPVVFLFLYTGLYARGLFLDLRILGKEIYSGREGMYMSLLDSLSRNWVFGDVRNYYFMNLHNGALAVLCSCGVAGFVIHFLFYRNRIEKYFATAQSSIQYIALIVILGIYLHASAEAALIVGGAHYSIIVATFFWIVKGEAQGVAVMRAPAS